MVQKRRILAMPDAIASNKRELPRSIGSYWWDGVLDMSRHTLILIRGHRPGTLAVHFSKEHH